MSDCRRSPSGGPSPASILQSLAAAGIDIKSILNRPEEHPPPEAATTDNIRMLDALVSSLSSNSSFSQLPAQWPPPMHTAATPSRPPPPPQRPGFSPWSRQCDVLPTLRPPSRPPRPVPRAIPKRPADLGHGSGGGGGGGGGGGFASHNSSFIPLQPPTPPAPLLLTPGGLPSALLQAAPFLGDPSSWPFAVVQRPETGEPCFALVLASLKAADPKPSPPPTTPIIVREQPTTTCAYRPPPPAVGPPRPGNWWDSVFDSLPPPSTKRNQRPSLVSPLRSLLNDNAILGDLDIPLPEDVERLSRRRAEKRPAKRSRPLLSSSPTALAGSNFLTKPKWVGDLEFSALLSHKNNSNGVERGGGGSSSDPPEESADKRPRGRPPKVEPAVVAVPVKTEEETTSREGRGASEWSTEASMKGAMTQPQSPIGTPDDEKSILKSSGWTLENFYAVARRRELIALGLGSKAATSVIADEWDLLRGDADKFQSFAQSVVTFLSSDNLPLTPAQSDLPRDVRKFRQLVTTRLQSPWEGAVTEALQSALDAEEDNGTFSTSPVHGTEVTRDEGPITRRRSQRLNKEAAELAALSKSQDNRATSSDDDERPCPRKSSNSEGRVSGESSTGQRSSPTSSGRRCPKFILGGIDRRSASSCRVENFPADTPTGTISVEFWDFKIRRDNRAWEDLSEKRLPNLWKSIMQPGSLVQLALRSADGPVTSWWDAVVSDCCGDFINMHVALGHHPQLQEFATMRSAFVPPNVPIMELQPGLWRTRPAKVSANQIPETAARLSRGGIVVVNVNPNNSAEMRDAQICDVWYSPSRPLTVGLRPLGLHTANLSVVAEQIRYILPFDLHYESQTTSAFLIPVCTPGKFTDGDKVNKIDSNIITLERSIASVPSTFNLFASSALIARIWRLGLPAFAASTDPPVDRLPGAVQFADSYRPLNWTTSQPPAAATFPGGVKIWPDGPRGTHPMAKVGGGMHPSLSSILHSMHLHFQGQPEGPPNLGATSMHPPLRPPLGTGMNPLVFLRRNKLDF